MNLVEGNGGGLSAADVAAVEQLDFPTLLVRLELLLPLLVLVLKIDDQKSCH